MGFQGFAPLPNEKGRLGGSRSVGYGPVRGASAYGLLLGPDSGERRRDLLKDHRRDVAYIGRIQGARKGGKEAGTCLLERSLSLKRKISYKAELDFIFSPLSKLLVNFNCP